MPDSSDSFRMTRLRELILEEFQAANYHPTADVVYEHLRRKSPDVSLSSVYRNLDVLTQAGKIKKLWVGGGQKQYDGGMHLHYHIQCTQCGKVSDVQADPFPDLNVAGAEGLVDDFEVVGHHLEFWGICADCRDKRRTLGDKQGDA